MMPYPITIELQNIPFPIRLDVEEETAIYIKGLLDERALRGSHPILKFDDIEGRTYLINSTFLTRVIFVDLTPPAVSVTSSIAEDMSDNYDQIKRVSYALQVYLAHAPVPIRCSSLTCDDINLIATHPDLHEWSSSPMIAFRDEDNDLNLINPTHVVMMEWHDQDTVSGFAESEQADRLFFSKNG